MKVVSALIQFLLFSPLALAAQPQATIPSWEACLDRGDFRFDADTFLQTNRVAKAACRFTFTGQESRRFEIDLCAPVIRIQEFAKADAPALNHEAGSAACPAPLFGADFGFKAGSEGFQAARTEVFAILAKVKKALAPEAVPEDAQKIGQAGKDSAKAKIACAELLLKDYLERCEAFPPPKAKN